MIASPYEIPTLKGKGRPAILKEIKRQMGNTYKNIKTH